MENSQTDSNQQEKNNQIIQDFFSPITVPISIGLDFLKTTGQSLGLITKDELDLKIITAAIVSLPVVIPYIIFNGILAPFGKSIGAISPENEFFLASKKLEQFLTEKVIIPMITPLFPISNALKSMEESIGLIAQDPRVDESSEQAKEPLIVKPQGFDNPNKLDPVS